MQSDIVAPPAGNQPNQLPVPFQPEQAASRTQNTVGNDVASAPSDLHLGLSPRQPKEGAATPAPEEASANQTHQSSPPLEAQSEIKEELQQPNEQKKSSHAPVVTIVLAVIIFLALSGLAIYRELSSGNVT